MPLPREGKILDYSRWQQNIVGVLQTDIFHKSNVLLDSHSIMTIDAKLAYRNIGDPDEAWKHYASSIEQRHLDCLPDNVCIF